MQQTIMQWLIMVSPYAAGLLSILGIVKVLWPKLKLGWEMAFGNKEIKAELSCLKDSINFIVEELKENNGRSLRDSVNRIECGVEKSVQRQRAFLDNSNEMIFETDTEGNYEWVNRTYANRVGRLPGDLMGRGWINVIAEDQRDKIKKDWYQAAKENRSYEATLVMQTSKGKKFKAYVRSQRMLSDSKVLLGFIGYIYVLEDFDA